MILGDTCTRRCGFCNVKTGKPTWNDPLEPARVARSVARMGLRHAVITTVDRDDLPDYGAGVFVGVIRRSACRRRECKVEVPDARLPRRGDAAGEGHRRAPRRLQPQRRGRPAAVPGRPPRLALGALAARAAPTPRRWAATRSSTKSGLMVGLGETHDEMVDAFGELREHGVQVLTVGQYLRPTERHLPVVRYWHPDEFKALEAAAYELGFEHIAAGPLVRSSSYHADEHVAQDRPGIGPLAAA